MRDGPGNPYAGERMGKSMPALSGLGSVLESGLQLTVVDRDVALAAPGVRGPRCFLPTTCRLCRICFCLRRSLGCHVSSLLMCIVLLRESCRLHTYGDPSRMEACTRISTPRA